MPVNRKTLAVFQRISARMQQIDSPCCLWPEMEN